MTQHFPPRFQRVLQHGNTERRRAHGAHTSLWRAHRNDPPSRPESRCTREPTMSCRKTWSGTRFDCRWTCHSFRRDEQLGPTCDLTSLATCLTKVVWSRLFGRPESLSNSQGHRFGPLRLQTSLSDIGPLPHRGEHKLQHHECTSRFACFRVPSRSVGDASFMMPHISTTC